MCVYVSAAAVTACYLMLTSEAEFMSVIQGQPGQSDPDQVHLPINIVAPGPHTVPGSSGVSGQDYRNS